MRQLVMIIILGMDWEWLTGTVIVLAYLYLCSVDRDERSKRNKHRTADV
jgi:hypothetical protein